MSDIYRCCDRRVSHTTPWYRSFRTTYSEYQKMNIWHESNASRHLGAHYWSIRKRGPLRCTSHSRRRRLDTEPRHTQPLARNTLPLLPVEETHSAARQARSQVHLSDRPRRHVPDADAEPLRQGGRRRQRKERGSHRCDQANPSRPTQPRRARASLSMTSRGVGETPGSSSMTCSLMCRREVAARSAEGRGDQAQTGIG